MKTREPAEVAMPVGPSPARDLRHRAAAVGSSLAGPAVIATSVLIVLRAFAFRGMLTAQHPDLLSTFLPSWCFLGRSLASGHIPAWNPHVMAGVPFAGDPLSGWANVPVMALFSIFPCAFAMRWVIVLQPLVAGLGVYWFLRTEGTSRVAATVGGTMLALAIAGSAFALALAFAATLTWTAWSLAGAARLMRARSWPGRLVWLALTALAWGELAATHLSNGTVPGSIALVIYLAAKAASQVRRGERTIADVAAVGGLLLLALPLVNLWYLLPRIGYLPRSTLGQGYVRLQQRLSHLRGVPNNVVPLGGINPTFPLRFTVPGGVYLGALAFPLAFAGWRDRRLLHLVTAFSLFGGVSFLIALSWTVRHAARHLGSGSLGSFYLHETQRFAFPLLLAIALLAGLGVEAWRRQGPLWERAAWLIPGLLVWALIAPALGIHRTLGWLPVATIFAGIAALAVAAYRPAVFPIVVGLVAAELLVMSVGPASALGLVAARRAGQMRPYLPLQASAEFPASSYFVERPIARAIAAGGQGRYLSIAPSVWSTLGYHVRRTAPFWGLMGAQQSMLFDLEEGQGYNSIQELRYWEFVRVVDPKLIRYNAAGFVQAEPIALDLLQVRYLIQPVEDPPAVAGEVPMARQGRWVVYRLPGDTSRASLATSWSVAGSSEDALTAILDPGFRSADRAIVDGRQAFEPSTATVPARAVSAA